MEHELIFPTPVLEVHCQLGVTVRPSSWFFTIIHPQTGSIFFQHKFIVVTIIVTIIVIVIVIVIVKVIVKVEAGAPGSHEPSLVISIIVIIST